MIYKRQRTCRAKKKKKKLKLDFCYLPNFPAYSQQSYTKKYIKKNYNLRTIYWLFKKNY